MVGKIVDCGGRTILVFGSQQRRHSVLETEDGVSTIRPPISEQVYILVRFRDRPVEA